MRVDKINTAIREVCYDCVHPIRVLHSSIVDRRLQLYPSIGMMHISDLYPDTILAAVLSPIRHNYAMNKQYDRYVHHVFYWYH